jgi:superfamily II DNA/RNA helicase
LSLSSGLKDFSSQSEQSSRVIAVNDLSIKKWFRALLLSQVNSFGDTQNLKCFFIDTGEIRVVLKNSCSQINNKNLQKFPPLAKHCSLFGIDALSANSSQDWIPSATQCFLELLQKTSTTLYIKYTNKVSNLSNYDHLNQIMLYLKLKDQDDLLSYYNFICSDNKNNKKTDLIYINEYLITKKFALANKSRDQHLAYADTSNLECADENEFYNVLSLKQFLTKKDVNAIDSCPQKQIMPQTTLNTNFISTRLGGENVLIDGFDGVDPILSIENKKLHQSVRDYLRKSIGHRQLSDFAKFSLPVIFRGRHLFGMSSEPTGSDDYLYAYLCPLLSLLLEKMEKDVESNLSDKTESGYVKHSMNRTTSCQNGPFFLIVCTSCKSALRIYEIIKEILDITSRFYRTQYEKYRNVKQLRCILLEGGGNDVQYEVPLINGCEILISSTPFSLLRMIGHGLTNLERLQYLVFDEANVLVEKFPRQIKTLMSHYHNLLKINDNQPVAQLILMTHYWSNKLNIFLQSYMMSRVVIATNKLEASYLGRTHHIMQECDNDHNPKLKNLNDILSRISSNTKVIKHTIIFANKDANDLAKMLINMYNYSNVNLIHKGAKALDIKQIEQKWKEIDDKPISYDENNNSKENKNLILIIDQSSINYVNIDNAKCIIHYDFPETKSAFAQRLWFMRKFFAKEKTVSPTQYDTTTATTTDESTHINLNEIEQEARSKVELNLELLGDSELVLDDDQRILSFIFLTKYDKEYSEGLLNFLRRIGFNERYIPRLLVQMAQRRASKKELTKETTSLCHYVKSFGECMEINKMNCKYRHKPNARSEAIHLLDEETPMPSEGYVKFKVAHVVDTNHCYIHLLGHQDLRLENTIEYNKFINFDAELQFYFSNPDNITDLNSFKEHEIYAYKDIDTSIFKRIAIMKITKQDKNIVYEVKVKAIDYGVNYYISTHELIKLPSSFKKLPPQALEVFFCDIRPIDMDLNWSNSSTLFINDRLLKGKKFLGKIQLAAKNTLWLDQINSFVHLKAVDMHVIDDRVRQELIENNYACHYPRHMKLLKELFRQSGLAVPRTEDAALVLERDCLKLQENLYDFKFDRANTISYAYLNRTENVESDVYVSAVETPNKFYLQNIYSNDLLDKLNQDIMTHLEKINSLKQLKRPFKNLESLRLSAQEKELEKRNEDYLKRTQSLQETLTKAKFDWFEANKLGMYCIAKLTKAAQSEYYRAKIVSITEPNDLKREDDEIRVFFVDYGDYDTVKRDEIYPLDQHFIRTCPFQALECSLDGIGPLNQTKWISSESGDFLWSQTHHDNGVFVDSKACVITSHDLIEFDSNGNNNSREACNQNTASGSKQKHYVVKLLRQSYPKNIDIAHQFVKMKLARLTREEEEFVFDSKKINESKNSDLSSLAKLLIENFVTNAHVDDQQISKQNDYIKLLEFHTATISSVDKSELVSTGLIQTIGRALTFIQNSAHITSLLKFMQNAFFSVTNSQLYIQVFFDSLGFSNLFKVLDESREEKLTQTVLDFLLQVLASSDELVYLFLTNENYLKATWNLVFHFKSNLVGLKMVIQMLEQIVDSPNNANIHISYKLLKFAKSRIRESEFEIERTSGGVEQFEVICKLFEAFVSRKKVDHSLNATEADDVDEEEKEKMRRVFEFVACNTDKIDETAADAAAPSNMMLMPNNNNYLQYKNQAPVSPPHSSDDEVEERFYKEMLNLYANAHNFMIPRLPVDIVNEWEEKKEYKYPKIKWNQTSDSLVLNVLLEGIQTQDVSFQKKLLIFRAKLSNDVSYGFDFVLYDEIEGCKVEKELTCFVIFLKKTKHGIWPRLLSNMNTPKFIKCEYNNLSDSDEVAERNMAQFREKLEKDRPKTKKRYNVIMDDSVSSSSDSDASSDFDGNVCHDGIEGSREKDARWE